MTREEVAKERAELSAKMQKLDDEEKKIKEEENKLKMRETQKLVQLMKEHKELVLAMFPKHDRSSCSDNNRVNGMDTDYLTNFKCKRCAILDILDDYCVDDFDISFDLYIRSRNN